MIYVHRDWTKVPKEKLDALKALAAALDEIEDKSARKKYIEENKAAWSTVREELFSMSHRKCWYTEAQERVSRYHTDHYRPHGRAKQAEKSYSDGYCWLAFDIENYRIVGMLSNTQNQEYSDETVGKGDWFPLENPASRATLENRNLGAETPVLLDPTDLDDVDKILFNDNGEAAPRPELPQAEQERVKEAIRHLGISQSQLNGARRGKWRECVRRIDKYDRFFLKPKGERTAEENETLRELAEELVTMALSKSEFSAAMRCCLESRRLGKLVVRDELLPLKLDT
jgi:hypothetical protein